MASTKLPMQMTAAVQFKTLTHLLEYQAECLPNAPAILGQERAPLTYAGLHQHVEKMGRTLGGLGIRRNDRIAVMLPNGPELAVAILAVATSAVCAPLNPGLGIEEVK